VSESSSSRVRAKAPAWAVAVVAAELVRILFLAFASVDLATVEVSSSFAQDWPLDGSCEDSVLVHRSKSPLVD
jgi:uncharacterized integral membrane protein